MQVRVESFHLDFVGSSRSLEEWQCEIEIEIEKRHVYLIVNQVLDYKVVSGHVNINVYTPRVLYSFQSSKPTPQSLFRNIVPDVSRRHSTQHVRVDTYVYGGRLWQVYTISVIKPHAPPFISSQNLELVLALTYTYPQVLTLLSGHRGNMLFVG